MVICSEEVLSNQALSEVIKRLHDCFNRDAAEGINEVYQFFIPDAGNYYLIVKESTCQLQRGETAQPSVVLTMNLDTLMSILNGSFSGVQAFMFGKVKVQGDMRLATKLGFLFQPESIANR